MRRPQEYFLLEDAQSRQHNSSKCPFTVSPSCPMHKTKKESNRNKELEKDFFKQVYFFRSHLSRREAEGKKGNRKKRERTWRIILKDFPADIQNAFSSSKKSQISFTLVPFWSRGPKFIYFFF